MNIRKTSLENKQNKLIKKWQGTKVPKKKPKKVRKPYKVFPSTIHLRHRPYSDFLVSDYWYMVRKLVIKRDRKKCVTCGASENLQVHHTTYKNHFNEHNHLEDLQTLCDQCHTEQHRN